MKDRKVEVSPDTWAGLLDLSGHELKMGPDTNYKRVRAKKNGSFIFPTAKDNWGSVGYIAIYANKHGGNPLIKIPFTNHNVVYTGSKIKVPNINGSLS